MCQKTISVKIVQNVCFDSIAEVHRGLFSSVRTRRSITFVSAGSVVGVKIHSRRAMCWKKFLQASVPTTFFPNEVGILFSPSVQLTNAGANCAQISEQLVQLTSAGQITTNFLTKQETFQVYWETILKLQNQVYKFLLKGESQVKCPIKFFI